MNFSVLMSLYYKEIPEYLNECLASIDRQSLKPTECIIVFDGPVGDKLEDVVEFWKKKLNIKVCRLEKNVGLGNALNEGLKFCNYELIARMDTDDICHSLRFERQIGYMVNHPDIIVLGSSIAEFNKEIFDSDVYRVVPFKYKAILKYYKMKSPFNHMTVVFRRSIILSNGGYMHHHLMEDYNLWLRIISKGYKVENIPEVLVYARIGNNMISRRRGWKYVISEYYLAKLKISLNIQSYAASYSTFFIRALPRLLPVFLLSYVYRLNRSKSIYKKD
ncbi:glycosyltransferase [Pragia fontium]|uniref:glycosyltransferase n=1 Tax=Pragia fontium TaxID=82985 RepID=UPI00064A7F09|nr:glycosyltransferase [Pragia fontium]AKJ42871.1 amylovoran biosynthesis protein AmsE [Pragia fontium]